MVVRKAYVDILRSAFERQSLEADGAWVIRQFPLNQQVNNDCKMFPGLFYGRLFLCEKSLVTVIILCSLILNMNKEGAFLEKLRCCVGGRY